MLFFSVRSRALLALVAGLPSALADRGPAEVTLKFDPPPPPVLTPAEAVAAMRVEPGFEVQVVASEPMIDTPVAAAFDHLGRLYVAEMRGYMPNTEAQGEDGKTGRVKRLEDTDGDGVMDKSTVFADNLVLPRGVMPLGDGALILEPPFLTFYHDRDGDGAAEDKEVLYSDVGKAGGQPEYLPNSPTWALNNWIELGYHNMRYRWRGGKWLAETTLTRSQWGLTQDDTGRLFYSYNSNLLGGDLLPPQTYLRNPSLTQRSGMNAKLLASQEVWPAHPTPGVNRGYMDGTLRVDGTLANATGAGGATIYRGGLFPAEYAGNAFTPEPCGNLVKRLVLKETGGVITAESAVKDREFLASTDERFRPVNSFTGPDGALYIVDMARGVIQHKHYLTHYLEENIKRRQLVEPLSLGRIYRVIPKGARPAIIKLPDDTPGLVKSLESVNGAVRDMAQRRLAERADTAAATPLLTELAAKSANPLTRLHALWTLEGLTALTPEILTASFRDPDERVRAAAVRLADRTLFTEVFAMAADPSPRVRLEVAINPGALPGPDQDKAILTLLEKGGSPLIAEAIATGLRGRETETLEMLLAAPAASAAAVADSGILKTLAFCVMNTRRGAGISKVLTLAAGQPKDAPARRQILIGLASAIKAGSAKLIYLDAEPPALTALRKNSAGADEKPLAALDKILAWPGKPGVPPPPVVRPLTAAEQTLSDQGKVLYAAICGACHQPNGQGLDGLAPPLADSEWVLGPPDRLAKIVMHGLTGPVTVRGTTWSMEMPPVPGLSDEQIAGILTYLRREWEHTADPVSVEAVAKTRAAAGPRVNAWTAEELTRKRGK